MPQTATLLAVCDDLLAAIGHLRAVSENAGRPLPPSQIVPLVNRLLDARIQLSPPKTKYQHQTNTTK